MHEVSLLLENHTCPVISCYLISFLACRVEARIPSGTEHALKILETEAELSA